jgi:DnaK suppressor protein
MLKTSKIKLLQQKLLDQQASLLNVAEAGALAAQTVELDQARVGRLSRMDALQEQAMSQERLRRRDSELAAIAAALTRIALDEYGDCTECGNVIAEKRLEFIPSIALCLQCATNLENSGKKGVRSH